MAVPMTALQKSIRTGELEEDSSHLFGQKLTGSWWRSIIPDSLDFNLLLHPIMKADSVCRLHMHLHGGQYADLDYGAMRNKESLLQGHCMYVADMNSYNADIGLPQLLPNASVASVPGQPF
ncbi:g4461 [Coccomyxa viridis]|uniref:G4461 protein n=1 Tax=Coccomyxa viridis TaxID=1274662 RepID=A0ABP1FQB3_9CHLO